jgi:hypothetical protein
MQLTTARAEPDHVHLAPAYPIRRGWGITHPLQPATAEIELYTPTRIHSPKLQGDVALKLYVVIVCFKCFRGMLQVFYIDVVKVDRNIAHVAMVFSSVYPKCFICFRCTLQVFHLDVAKVDLDVAYTCMLQAYVSSVSYVCFKCFI